MVAYFGATSMSGDFGVYYLLIRTFYSVQSFKCAIISCYKICSVRTCMSSKLWSPFVLDP